MAIGPVVRCKDRRNFSLHFQSLPCRFRQLPRNRPSRKTAGIEQALELLAKSAAMVLKVMKSAEARVHYQICNGVGEARVRAGLAEVASR